MPLNDRRTAVACFPNRESRAVADNWKQQGPYALKRPWYGAVTFYEALEHPEWRPQMTINRDLGPGPPRPPPFPPPRRDGQSDQADGDGPAGSASSTGDTSRPPPGDFQRQCDAAKQQQPTIFYHFEEEPWEPGPSTCLGDRFYHHGELHANQHGSDSVLSLSSLRSCARRKRPNTGANLLHKWMTWTLSSAAHSFISRLCHRHAAQEGDPSSSSEQQPAVGDLQPDRLRRGHQAEEEEDGREEMRSCMVSHCDGTALHAAHDASADGLGLLAEEGQRRGDRGRAGQEGEVPDGHQEGQGDTNCPGNRCTTGPILHTEVLGEGARGMPTCCRVPEMPQQPLPDLVDVSDMRIKVGENQRHDKRVNFVGGARDTGCQEPQDHGGHLPEVPAGSKVETPTGSYPTTGGSPGPSWTNPWRHWVNTGPNSKAEAPQTKGASRQVLVQGTSNAWTEAIPSPEEVNLGRGREGDAGVGRGEELGRRGVHPIGPGGAGRPTDRRQQLLVSQSQLGGKHGQTLGSMLRSRFSKFMVFLCMNCVLPKATVTAFGSPDLVAWHYENEFDFTENRMPSTNAEDGFVACYVYGHPKLARHFANATYDSFGPNKQLAKETKKWLVGSLKKTPRIMEVYSPPRTTPKAAKYGFASGGALDLSTGWDLSKKSHQKAALRLVREQQPVLVILSPPCTVFSRLRGLSNFKRPQHVVQEEEAAGLAHLRFAVLLAKIQHRAGRGFLFEHPRYATSWTTEDLQELQNLDGVFTVPVDLCRFGLRTSQGVPALKPTLLLTNLEGLAVTLNRRCDGAHAKHQPLLSGEAGLAAKYTPAFVDAILRGLRQHVQNWVKNNNLSSDYWEQKDAAVVRHHRTPRRAFFSPSGVAGCPQKLRNLSSERTTVMKFDDNKMHTVVDNWRATTPRQSMPKQWTGSTTFPVQDPIVLPPDWVAAANCVVQAAAHPIYSYITEETDVQMEWTTAFPSHKVLGGSASKSPSDPSNPSLRYAGDETDDLEAHMLDDVDMPENPEETSEQRVQQALQPVEVNQRPVDNVMHPEIRREIYKIHRNLGHPSLPLFTRSLRHAGVKPEIVKWVKQHFRCALCERRQQPSQHRPARLHHAMSFNEVVGVDLILVDAGELGEHWMLNCLCWGTDLQIVEPTRTSRLRQYLKLSAGAGWLIMAHLP